MESSGPDDSTIESGVCCATRPGTALEDAVNWLSGEIMPRRCREDRSEAILCVEGGKGEEGRGRGEKGRDRWRRFGKGRIRNGKGEMGEIGEGEDSEWEEGGEREGRREA